VTLTTHPPSSAEVMMSRTIPLLPLWARVACYRVKPYLNLPYLTLTLPYLTVPYLTLPYLTLPYLTLPNNILQFRVAETTLSVPLFQKWIIHPCLNGQGP
jgi:hypothetical protein